MKIFVCPKTIFLRLPDLRDACAHGCITNNTMYSHVDNLNENASYNNVTVHNVTAEVLFRNIPENLTRKLKKWPVFVSCMAWLTEDSILEHMDGKSLGIVIQKDGDLREDAQIDKRKRNWAQNVRSWYECTTHNMAASVKHPFTGYDRFDRARDPWLGTVRCAGIAPQGGQPRPLMHNKFIVFGDLIETTKKQCLTETDESVKSEKETCFVPKAVWTGSFNCSVNGSRSLENAVYIEDDALAAAYHKEWAQIYIKSQDLDWEITKTKGQEKSV